MIKTWQLITLTIKQKNNELFYETHILPKWDNTFENLRCVFHSKQIADYKGTENYLQMKRSITFWVIMALIVVNISAIIAMIYMSRTITCNITKNEEFKCPNPREYLIQELKLNENQTIELKNLHKQHRQKAKVLFGQMIKKQTVLFDEINKDYPDSVIIETQLHELGIIHAELQSEAMEHYKNLQKICNTEQKEKLKVLYKDIIVKKHHFPKGFKDHPPHDHGKKGDNSSGCNTMVPVEGNCS